MKIKVGEYDILESGTVIGNENEPVDFILDTKTNFTLRMNFKDDDSLEKKPSIKAELLGENILQILFKNFDNPLGNGNVKPIKLGVNQGRELSINYRIYSIEESGKLIHYTFLLGKEVQDGK